MLTKIDLSILLKGVITSFINSWRNYYEGCCHCKKSCDTDICRYCSSIEKKMFYTLRLKIRDYSSEINAIIFDNVDEKFMGKTA